MTTSARPVPSAWSASGDGRPPGRQGERSDLSTRRLLDAAASLIAERGYERTTLADIGRRAGYSQGLVTRRFGSKANLLAVLVERMAVRFGPAGLSATVGDRSGAAAVAHLVREIRLDIARAPQDVRSFYALLFEGLKPVPELHERLRDLNSLFRRSLAEILADGLESGSVRPGTDPEAAADLVASCLRGIAYFWLLDPDDFDVSGRLEDLAAQLDGFLGP